MKKYLILISLALIALSFEACEDGDGGSDLSFVLQYDGDNTTGPILPAGTHELAVRFTEKELTPYLGKSLEAIYFFVGNRPAECQLVIYGANNASRPGTVLYSANVTNALTAPNWNTHKLATPIEITGTDLWLSIRVTLAQQQQSIGCDAGPNKPNGDWLYRSDDRQWIGYEQRTGERVNWNIRGLVSQ